MTSELSKSVQYFVRYAFDQFWNFLVLFWNLFNLTFFTSVKCFECPFQWRRNHQNPFSSSWDINLGSFEPFWSFLTLIEFRPTCHFYHGMYFEYSFIWRWNHQNPFNSSWAMNLIVLELFDPFWPYLNSYQLFFMHTTYSIHKQYLCKFLVEYSL